MPNNNISGGSLSLLPGMSVQLEVKGYYARLEPYTVYNAYTKENDDKTLVNGFYMDDEEAGTLTAIEGRAAVRYTHIKARENNIWFVARTEVNGEPELGVFRIIYVPVHDHASIVTGGPAYGTYHSEGARQVQEEGT
jgi:hypothetical protein